MIPLLRSILPGALTTLVILAGTAVLQLTDLFPTTVHGFSINDQSISHPVLPEMTLPGPALLLLCLILEEALIAGIVTLRRQPLAYMVAGCGNLLTLSSTVLAKRALGVMRPCFLELCQPDTSLIPPDGWVNGTLARVVCRGGEMEDGRQSFPSSHTSQVGTTLFLLFYPLFAFLNLYPQSAHFSPY